MKRLTTAALAAFVSITFFTSAAFAAPKRAQHAAAKCVGAANCRACKNCRYCRHCARDSGTCGVCRRRKAESPENLRTAESAH